MDKIKIPHHGRTVDGVFYKPEKERFPVLVCSHGYNGHLSDFAPMAEFLAENGIGVFLFTFCGGSTRDESGFPTTEMTLFTEKEDLFSVMDYLKGLPSVKEIFLFGGSQGGMVSALAAEERAEEVKGLILLFPAFCIADNWNERFPCEEDIPETVELWGMTLGRSFFTSLHGFDIDKETGNYGGKVLILHGREDVIVPLCYSERAAARYPHAALKVYEKERHGFTEEGNQGVFQEVLRFIKELI